jgi:hypothetical protein
VIVSHGRRPLEFERTILGDGVLIALGATLAARILAEFSASRSRWLAVSAVAWLVGWAWWGARALPPLLARDRPSNTDAPAR